MCIYIYILYIIYIETHLSVKSFCTNHRVQAFFLFFVNDWHRYKPTHRNSSINDQSLGRSNSDSSCLSPSCSLKCNMHCHWWVDCNPN